jgi:hypothetical protein
MDGAGEGTEFEEFSRAAIPDRPIAASRRAASIRMNAADR